MMMNIFLFNESDPKKASEYCKDLSEIFETMSKAQDYIRSKGTVLNYTKAFIKSDKNNLR
jgi:hypothetical protein